MKPPTAYSADRTPASSGNSPCILPQLQRKYNTCPLYICSLFVLYYLCAGFESFSFIFHSESNYLLQFAVFNPIQKFFHQFCKTLLTNCTACDFLVRLLGNVFTFFFFFSFFPAGNGKDEPGALPPALFCLMKSASWLVFRRRGCRDQQRNHLTRQFSVFDIEDILFLSSGIRNIAFRSPQRQKSAGIF